MSGGVDSTMAAFLLKQDGHEVVGLTMRLWKGDAKACGLTEERLLWCQRSRKILRRLKLPAGRSASRITRSIWSGNTKQAVLKNFSSEYLAGRTPNPCVLCNHFIKFGALLEHARASGIEFDHFATGHYARIEKDEATGRFLLKKATDLKKDQSYFLYRLTQPQLAQTLFPLGEFTKTQVKEMADEAGFAALADKPESQDFIDSGEYQKMFSAGRSQTRADPG